MHVTKEFRASYDYFRLMFVFSAVGFPLASLFVVRPIPIPFRVFVC